MLVFDASKRISVDDALCHPFLAALTRAHPQFLVTKPLVFHFEHQWGIGEAWNVDMAKRSL